jgi:lysophospholipase L1-like esterase
LFTIIGIIGCWALLKIGIKKRLRVTLLGLTSFLCLVGVECVLRFKEPLSIKKLRSIAAAQRGIAYDERSKIQVISDLKRDGLNVAPSFHPSSYLSSNWFAELLPLGGISDIRTVYANESGERTIYQSDRFGFRNPDTGWDVSKIDLLLIGDSFTQGACVPDGEDIGSQLREITDSNVICLGSGGNGPLLEYAILTEYGKRVSANTVLWMYFEGNDLFSDISSEKKNSILRKYLDEDFSQDLVNRQDEIDKNLHSFMDEKMKIWIDKESFVRRTKHSIKGWISARELRTRLSHLFKMEEDTFPLPKIEALREILSKAKDRVAEFGGKLVFVYLPAYERYIQSDYSDRYVSNRNKSDIIQMVIDLKLPAIDIHKEVFSMHSDPLSLFPYGLAGHYNANGYKKVAEAIAESLDK